MTWPFENDTSAITKKLAQRSFKANKLRNIVAVIAIVLTSMLFTSVTTLCVGAIQSIQTTILQIRGTSPSTGTSVNWIAIIAALFFIMIFVITGYLLIRNIFEISVVQEIKKYGLLRTIGTTEKQIKRIVYKQAFWLSIIGISIGLILGYIVGILMLPWILNFMKGEYHNLSVNLSFNPIIFVVAGIFSAITVWVSIKKPFKIAATISPIEATRYYEKDNYHSANKNRLSFKNRITEMAWRNLRRNSKRTIFIVLSMILCIILLNSAIAIGNSVDVKKYVSSVTSFDFVVASPNTFSNVQGFRFKDDSVSNEIISDIENNIPVLNGSRIYKNTLDDVSVTYDYGSLVTEVLDEYTEDNHLIRSGMVDGRTYPVKLGVDYRPLCNIYGVEKSILPKLNFIEGETDIQQLTSYLESGNYVIEISAINPNESPEFLCPLNQEVTIYKDGLPYKTVSVIARAVVDFSLVESPGKNVGYTDVGGDCPIFYMSNEMFVELYNNPAIMSYEKNKKGESYCKTNNVIKKEKLLLKRNHRLTNIRKNYLNQTTSEIVSRKPRFICIEDLNVSGMMKNRHLSKAVQNQGFFEFRKQLEYKCSDKGIQLIVADRFYPSSKLCSCCGNIKKDLKLSDRIYKCDCGNVIDRDFQASINLKAYGERVAS